MSYIVVLIGITVCFCALQAILSLRAKNPVVKSIPTGLLIIGLLFCLITYAGVGEIPSTSVIAENQVFAKFLAVHIAAGLIGCVAGTVFTGIRQTEQ